MEQFLSEAKDGSRVLSALSGAEKNRILREMAIALRTEIPALIEANALDMADGKKNNLTSALMDRLLLDESRIDSMAVAIEEIAALKEPVGRVLDGWVTEDGLKIEKVAVLQTLRNYKPKILESIYDGKTLNLAESIEAKTLLENQGLDTNEVRSNVYAKMIMPLFSIALLMILIFRFPFHSRYMNIAMTTTKAIGGTLFVWGILFALQGIAKNGTLSPELALILPIVLLWIYAVYTLGKSSRRI